LEGSRRRVMGVNRRGWTELGPLNNVVDIALTGRSGFGLGIPIPDLFSQFGIDEMGQDSGSRDWNPLFGLILIVFLF